MSNQQIIPVERIETKIYLIRGEKVMLDRDLAQLYGVSTSRLNEQVNRNIERFPRDFMFSLTRKEILRISQFAISSPLKFSKNINVFTEQGVAMLSGVLHSSRAVQANIAIMRAFVKLRSILATHHDLRRKLEELESKYDQQFKVVFDAIKALMFEPVKPIRKIGFLADRRLGSRGQ